MVLDFLIKAIAIEPTKMLMPFLSFLYNTKCILYTKCFGVLYGNISNKNIKWNTWFSAIFRDASIHDMIDKAGLSNTTHDVRTQKPDYYNSFLEKWFQWQKCSTKKNFQKFAVTCQKIIALKSKLLQQLQVVIHVSLAKAPGAHSNTSVVHMHDQRFSKHTLIVISPLQ